MMRAVEGGVTLLEPFALHGFLQHAHHEVGFLHEFFDHMGPFPWFHAWTPFRLLVLPACNATDSARAAVPTPRYLPRGYAPLSGSCTPVAISLAHTSGSLPLAREACHGRRAVFLPSHALGQRGRDAAPAFFGRLPPAACLSVQRVYAIPCVCSLASGLPSCESLPYRLLIGHDPNFPHSPGFRGKGYHRSSKAA